MELYWLASWSCREYTLIAPGILWWNSPSIAYSMRHSQQPIRGLVFAYVISYSILWSIVLRDRPPVQTQCIEISTQQLPSKRNPLHETDLSIVNVTHSIEWRTRVMLRSLQCVITRFKSSPPFVWLVVLYARWVLDLFDRSLTRNISARAELFCTLCSPNDLQFLHSLVAFVVFPQQGFLSATSSPHISKRSLLESPYLQCLQQRNAFHIMSRIDDVP